MSKRRPACSAIWPIGAQITINPASKQISALRFHFSFDPRKTWSHSFEHQSPSQLSPLFLLPLQMAAAEDPEDPADLFGEDEDEDGLFGDEDDIQSEHERALSDRELDSGDDEDRNDRTIEHADDVGQQIGIHDREARILDADFPRQAVPTPTDGEVS
jgi:hypothetical protein